MEKIILNLSKLNKVQRLSKPRFKRKGVEYTQASGSAHKLERVYDIV